MKFLVLSACLAVASAQLVTYPNGAVAPVKTPEVQAAEAAHFAAKGLPYGLGYAGLAGYGGYGLGGVYGAGLYGGAYGLGAYAGYPGYTGYPYAPALVAHPNGAVVPAEPADVVAARAAHLAAKATPLVAPVHAAVGPAGPIAPY